MPTVLTFSFKWSNSTASPTDSWNKCPPGLVSLGANCIKIMHPVTSTAVHLMSMTYKKVSHWPLANKAALPFFTCNILAAWLVLALVLLRLIFAALVTVGGKIKFCIPKSVTFLEPDTSSVWSNGQDWPTTWRMSSSQMLRRLSCLIRFILKYVV